MSNSCSSFFCFVTSLNCHKKPSNLPLTKIQHITFAFLNDLLGKKDEDRITDLTFENSEAVKDSEDGKTIRLDLLVNKAIGERINVEVEVINQHDMPERILYYRAKLYASSIYSGQPYIMLKPTIMISILNSMCLI
ncbi:Rpn family recombination-promoting nuclease/putative transposase [Schinkia azotoformans]|uniref:Rpn family recombination-promoting nuclease/putative transposase n=1 Tax=Schinkia azotoformans TaxID=1454 RepID=UPI002DBA2B5B|nr:Rpn family recombination-promoting nuclease/putative transposase [Schinkia azotoformans]MEC1697375.1 Rpn family recombination-promoting nuclease/putative transposase [Schinkia azotoformans]MEC1714605.1 Rpn family recombination-promoting nuclease/putative transposase [Schinkia azotoformans]MEC1742944.1 Rpn family recombination-promoting nuclease/putative transposase [Schinkia azotoformans]MEC1745379.1 Rpn family recombination-promoting nuclease/putative transposase [Schinkia azotoformans]MEC